MTIFRDLLKEFNSKILFFLALIFTIGILFSFRVHAFQKPRVVKLTTNLFYVQSQNPAGNTGYKNVLNLGRVGTRKIFQTNQTTTSKSPSDYSKFFGKYPSVHVVATGYTAGKESTGKIPSDTSFGITKSGVKVTRSLYSTVAADPNIFPIGTILYIPGYGLGVVADTGSKIHGYHLDLYFQSVDDVYNQWGKRVLDVYVIQKGKGHLTEAAMKQLNHQRIEQVIHRRPSYGM